MTAADPMDDAAALLNDAIKSVFTYAVQLPFLKIAYAELQEEMELANFQMTNEVSSTLVINVGVTSTGFATTPALPADLIEIQGLYERLSGSNEDYQIMTRVDYLPPYVQTTEALIYWTWEQQTIKFLGATSIRDVRLNYIGAVLTPIVDQTTILNLINCRTFLGYRTAALCAEFYGENKTRADALNEDAAIALSRFMGIDSKARQAMPTRRRPFMATYKVRGTF